MRLGHAILSAGIGVILGALFALIDIRIEEMEKCGLGKKTRWEVIKEELKNVLDEFRGVFKK